MIKIKLAILEQDQNYLTRIVGIFNGKFNDRLEVYSFTTEAAMLAYVRDNRVDVLLASEQFTIDPTMLNRCTLAYLTESNSIDTYSGQPAICKFQKAELIYKEILSLYSEAAEDKYGFKLAEEAGTKVLTYYSVNGGAGASTMAVACALNLVARGKRILYLNLEQLGDPAVFLSGEGTFTLSDIIFAIKSKKTNLAMKLESSVKQDVSGVYFFDACPTALDLFELSSDELTELLGVLRSGGRYDYIIVDADLDFKAESVQLMMRSDRLVFVSDGTAISNSKLLRIYETLRILESQSNATLIAKMALIYNKFVQPGSTQLDLPSAVPVFGGLPDFGRGDPRGIAAHLATTSVFSSL